MVPVAIFADEELALTDVVDALNFSDGVSETDCFVVKIVDNVDRGASVHRKAGFHLADRELP
jgi:hypothetical protein